MFKKWLSLPLTGLLVFIIGARPVCAASQAGDDAQTTEQVKVKIVRLGIGEKARATVKLKDGTKLKGYISQAGENDFTIRDKKTDAPTTVSYRDVAKVESNRGHSTAKHIGIGIGIGVGAFLAILAITFANLQD